MTARPSHRLTRAAFLPLPLLILILFLAAASAACDDGAESPARDVGVDYRSDDSVVPPDLTLRDSGWPTNANVGAPCDPGSKTTGCSQGLVCLDVRGSGSDVVCDLSKGEVKGCGVCVLTGCTVEDKNTAAKEDDCPRMTAPTGKKADTVCTAIPVASKSDAGVSVENVCLPSCDPSGTTNPCKALGHIGLSCDPASILLNDNHEVCLFPSCFKDTHCGNKNPLDPDSTCHLATGLCLNRGDKAAKIGDPCKVSADCGQYQHCFPEQMVGGKTVAKDGYCTLIGCKYGLSSGSAAFWQCPTGSDCFAMGSAKAVSFCLATGCTSTASWDKDGCRDGPSEVQGQYDCHPGGFCWLDVKSTK